VNKGDAMLPRKVRDEQFRRAAKDIADEGRTLLGQDRLWILWQAVKNVAALQLPAAEVGAYRGGSAAFIARAFADLAGRVPAIDVVDTFEGHPAEKLTAEDSEVHRPGLFGRTSFEEVRDYLSRHPEVRVHKGEFSAVAGELTEAHYGFAHIDVDLYEPTLDCLRFFSARMPQGGAIVVDDYEARKCPGIKRAAEEFLAETDAGFQAWNPLTEQLVLVKMG
jgi:O-methyltransferase